MNDDFSMDKGIPTNKPKVQTMESWCIKNGYNGVTRECVMSAFNSGNKDIQNLAKREKLKGLLDG